MNRSRFTNRNQVKKRSYQRKRRIKIEALQEVEDGRKKRKRKHGGVVLDLQVINVQAGAQEAEIEKDGVGKKDRAHEKRKKPELVRRRKQNLMFLRRVTPPGKQLERRA